MSQDELLIKAGRVITMVDGQPDEIAASIHVRDGRIAAILGADADVPGARVIDASGKIVMPGFVDTHRHVWQTQLRTVAADWTLYDYLVNMRSVYSGFYEAEDAYLGNDMGALEAVNAGITTVVDHCHLINSPDHTDRLIDGLEDSGIRAIFCHGMFINPKFNPFSMEQEPGWRYDDIARIRRERIKEDVGRIMLGVNPQEPESGPPQRLHDEVRRFRDLGVKAISMHVAMGCYDGQNRVVQHLADAGLLGPDMIFVHGAALTDDEIEAIRAAGSGISSTPETELQMGMGYPIALSGRDTGTRVSLGIDIVSNYPGDMFGQMRIAMQAARAQDNEVLAARHQAPRQLRVKARDALRLGTLGGAEALHMEDRIGTIEVGKAADIIVIGTESLAMTPAHDAIGAAVLGAAASDVDTVIIDGVVRKENGVLVGVDLPAMRARLLASAQRIHGSATYVPRDEIHALWGSIFPHLAD
jgi:cytosine/adenosine deaminase-related metal-dependent hydrolase